MSKYVNAADAAEKIAEKHGIRIADLCDTFGDIPAADVVEVVRCCTTIAQFDTTQKIWSIGIDDISMHLNALIGLDDLSSDSSYISHWMELPAPPKEGK